MINPLHKNIMKKNIYILVFLTTLFNTYSQDLDLIATIGDDSKSCHIDSITNTNIYLETKTDNNWSHKSIDNKQVKEYKLNTIDKKIIHFKPRTSSITISEKNRSNLIYVGFGLGINDYGLGTGIEIPLCKKLSILANFGVGFWGPKIGNSINFYLKQVSYGSGFSLGYTFSSGIEYETKFTTNLMYSYSWSFGKPVKLTLSFGCAIPYMVTDSTEWFMELQPGGIISGIKFMVGI